MSSGRTYSDYRFQVEGGLSSSRVSVRFLIPDDAWLKRQIVALIVQLTQPQSWEVLDGATVTLDQVLSEMSRGFDSLMFEREVGKIQAFMVANTSLLPGNYLPCDGSAYDTVDYPDLYAVLPESLKHGDTFNTPYLDGSFIVGAGINEGGTGYVVGESYGEEEVTLTIEQIPSHVHTVNETGLTAILEGAGAPFPAPSIASPTITGSSGGGDAHNNVPQSVAVIFGIVCR